MKFFLTIFLSLFVAYGYSEDVTKKNILPLTKIFKDEKKTEYLLWV